MNSYKDDCRGYGDISMWVESHLNLKKAQKLQQLIDAGIIPTNCYKWNLSFSPNHEISIHCESYLTEDQIALVCDFLIDNKEKN